MGICLKFLLKTMKVKEKMAQADSHAMQDIE
jgi:hypothetical protein